MKNKIKNQEWERLEDESSRAFYAFATYRDLGVKRSLVKVSSILSKNKTTLTNWSKKYNWVKRAQAYDDYQDKINLNKAQAINQVHRLKHMIHEKGLDIHEEDIQQLKDQVKKLSNKVADLTDEQSQADQKRLRKAIEQEREVRGGILR